MRKSVTSCAPYKKPPSICSQVMSLSGPRSNSCLINIRICTNVVITSQFQRCFVTRRHTQILFFLSRIQSIRPPTFSFWACSSLWLSLHLLQFHLSAEDVVGGNCWRVSGHLEEATWSKCLVCKNSNRCNLTIIIKTSTWSKYDANMMQICKYANMMQLNNNRPPCVLAEL